MRKLINTILTLAAGITLLAACQEKTGDLNFATNLSVDKNEVVLEAAGAQATVTLTANGEWIAVAPDWLHVSPGSGSGNAVLTITAPDNENEFKEMMGPRGQVLYIYGEGVTLQVAIKQGGLDALDATRIYKKISSMAEFDAGKSYIVAFTFDDVLYAGDALPGTPGDGRYQYWCQKPPVVVDEDGAITYKDASLAFNFKAVDGGYAIQEPGGGYLYQSKGHNTSFYAATAPEGGDVWTMEFNDAGQVILTNITEAHSNGILQYMKSNYQEFCCEATYPASNCYALYLYKDEAAPTDEILNVEDLTVEADATQASIPVTSNKTWTVRNHDEWINSFAKNQDGTAIEVTFDANEGATAAREASFTVIGETTNKVVKLIQKAPVVEINVTDKTVAVGRTVAAGVSSNSKGEISYVSNDTGIATVSAQGVITGVAPGETTITATVAEYGIYPEASKDFKVTVTEAMPEVTTVAGITEQITATSSSNASAYEANLTGAVVSYVNGSNVFIEDASGAILLYLNNSGLKAGDTIKGKVSGTGYKYNGLPEITSLGTEYTKGTGGTLPLTEITIAQLLANFDANISRRVVIKGCKVTDGIGSGDRNGKISQGESEIALYDKSKNVVLAQDAEGDLIAYPCPNNATKQLAVFESSEFTPAGGVVTTLTVSDKTVQVGKTVSADVQTNSPGAITYTSDNAGIARVDAQGTITGVSEGETNINVSLAASGDYEAKTASFKVTVTAAPSTDPTTVAEITAQITSTDKNNPSSYEANLTGAVVSYVNGNNAYLEDASGAILIYLSGHGLQAGDVVTGKLSGKGYKYNNLPELTSIGSEFTKTAGGTIPLTEMTIAQLKAAFTANLSRRIILKGITVTDGLNGNSDRNGKAVQADGAEIILRDQSKSVVIAQDAQGDLICYPCIFNSDQQVSVWVTSDFTAGGSGSQTIVPTITVSDKTVQVGATVSAAVQTDSPGTLSYSSSNTQVATVDAKGDITGVAVGEADITVSVAASGNYEANSATFKVTVTEASSSVPTTVAGIVAQITSTSSSNPSSYEANLTGAVVTYVNGSNVFIEDASGAILYYKSNSGLAAGDVITGKVSGTGYKYKGLPEVTVIGTDFTKTSGGTIPLTEITLANLLANFDANISRRVVVKGVTVTDGINGPSNDRSGEISQGNDKIALYDKSKAVVLTQGANGDLIGYPCPNDATLQMAVFETSDFTASGGVTTTLTVSDKTVYVGRTVSADVQTNSPGTLSFSSSNTQVATVDAKGDITGVAVGEANITVNLAASGAYEAKEATFKVTVSQAPAGGYVKVTSAPSDWAGTYLLVYEAGATGNKVFCGISDTSTKYGLGEDVTISNGTIASAAALEADELIIAATGTAGEYTIKYGTKYLYWGSGNSLNANANITENTTWTLSKESDGVKIVCKKLDGTDQRIIRYNTSSPRFACYKSGQAAVQLYKKQ